MRSNVLTSSTRAEHFARLGAPADAAAATSTQVTHACEVRVLDAHVRISGPRSVLDELQSLFGSAATASATGPAGPNGPRVASLAVRSGTACPGWYEIEQEGMPVWRTNERSDVLASLEWTVNNAAVEQLGAQYVLFHAGAVARNGRGILLPAVAGSGKTTLVAGLISTGSFEYFSDEVGVLDPSTGMLLPFPKSLCVKAGSRATLSPMYPGLRDTLGGRRFGGQQVWYVPPPARVVATSPVPVRHVVFPCYRAHAPTRLEPVSRSTALARLMEQSFSLRRHGAEGMRAVVETLAQADCYTLTVGALDEAVELMQGLTGEVCHG